MGTPRLITDDIRDLFSDLAVPDPISGQPVDLEDSLTALTLSLLDMPSPPTAGWLSLW